MSVDHTRTSRGVTIVATLLVLVQLVHLLRGDHAPYVEALLLALVLATGSATVRLHHGGCVESRLAVALLAGLSGTGTVLAMTVGLPGRAGPAWSLLGAITLVLSAAVLGLLALDLSWRAARQRARSPYAV